MKTIEKLPLPNAFCAVKCVGIKRHSRLFRMQIIPPYFAGKTVGADNGPPVPSALL